jgi:hypothetical protein
MDFYDGESDEYGECALCSGEGELSRCEVCSDQYCITRKR